MPTAPPHADAARRLHGHAVGPGIDGWFARRGWKPFDFQRQAWRAYLAGRSGLIHAPTGMGKTQAAWLGPVAQYLAQNPAGVSRPARLHRDGAEPLRVLWITPLRALAADTAQSLALPIADLALPWTIEQRTGDTSASVKARQRTRLPTALITTPESLSLLLSYPDARERLASLCAVIVDEWHELIGTKRGVQVELALARLRAWNPAVRTWGLSATLGNTEQAAQVLVGPRFDRSRLSLIQGHSDKQIEIVTIIPDRVERFPWAGHLGLTLLPKVLAAVESAATTLLFTNTRSQAEIWFRQIVLARPDWLGQVALHHGSLDRVLRSRVERRLDSADQFSRAHPGRLRCVVCTSSLDLGVDFAPVDQVIQIGSPKGVARLLQRAGRSGHQPGAVSRLIGVPTHALELVEYAAARAAVAAGRLEARTPVRKPFDVLVQHLVTVALGGGFDEDALRDEVRSTHAFSDLTDAEWSWAMDFVQRGGPSLTAYPRYLRVAPSSHTPRWCVASQSVARWHRLNIGTIVADAAMSVRITSGRNLGTIEESFITRLRPGDRFVFAGRTLELVRIRDMTVYARAARGSAQIPSWDGGRMPLSSHLSAQFIDAIDRARRGSFDSPEMQAARPLLELQAAASHLPAPDELLIEQAESRHGSHAFLFPFAGRLAHEALAALLSHRLTRLAPRSVSSVATDYGIELLTTEPIPRDEALWRTLLTPEQLLDDLIVSFNTTQMSRRQFREIARIAGLILQGYPGQRAPARQVQASTEMFYDVFSQYDPGNLLLEQSRRELLEGQLELRRLRDTLDRIASSRLVMIHTPRFSPLAFPLFAESLRIIHASSEKWGDRIRKMVGQLEAAATPTPTPSSRRRKPARA